MNRLFQHAYLLAALAVVLGALLATAWMLPHLPPTVPMHWNAHGQVDRMGSRAELFILPLVMAGLLALWPVLARVSPQGYGVERFHGTYWFGGFAVMAVLAFIHVLTLCAASGAGIDGGRAVAGALAVLFILLGNVMGKVKPNFWMGIRTPWTLTNERVWYATHRLAAKTMTVAGLAGLLLVGLKLQGAVTPVLVAGALLPAAWSLRYYRRLESTGR